MSDAPYNIQDFGPSDLMSSDVVGERALKVALTSSDALDVSLVNLTEVEKMLLKALTDISINLCSINEQITLMNARFEDVHETTIETDDLP